MTHLHSIVEHFLKLVYGETLLTFDFDVHICM